MTITSSNLHAIIAETNSIHRRTQAREKSAAAPANAKGASTAATRIISLRIIIAAHTITHAAMTSSEKISSTAGLMLLSALMTSRRLPRPEMLVPIVSCTTPADRASTAVSNSRVVARANADPTNESASPITPRRSAPGSRHSAPLITWITNNARHSTPAMAPVIASSRTSDGEVRSSRVATSICRHNQVVISAAALPNDRAMLVNASLAALLTISPGKQIGFSRLMPEQLIRTAPAGWTCTSRA
ncbi:hypothetical protein [Flexivirga alba]|uniref:Uncharacterized protein n=1 Tax=Flexivirga alba TaxID=702742 RepID=A0ABW2AJA6_9MICO